MNMGWSGGISLSWKQRPFKSKISKFHNKRRKKGLLFEKCYSEDRRRPPTMVLSNPMSCTMAFGRVRTIPWNRDLVTGYWIIVRRTDAVVRWVPPQKTVASSRSARHRCNETPLVCKQGSMSKSEKSSCNDTPATTPWVRTNTLDHGPRRFSRGYSKTPTKNW